MRKRGRQFSRGPFSKHFHNYSLVYKRPRLEQYPSLRTTVITAVHVSKEGTVGSISTSIMKHVILQQTYHQLHSQIAVPYLKIFIEQFLCL